MAFAFDQVRQQRLPRLFRERQTMENLRDYDLRDYRLPREMISTLVDGYTESIFANKTHRSHAISPVTEVS